MRARRVLPLETTNYVPIILAMTIMTKNAAAYGLTDITPEDPLEYDTRTHHSNMDVYDRVQADDMKQAAVIIGETAGIHRFRDKDAYARFTGTAPEDDVAQQRVGVARAAFREEDLCIEP